MKITAAALTSTRDAGPFAGSGVVGLAALMGATAVSAPGDDEQSIIAAMGGKPDPVIETAGKAAVLAQAYALAWGGVDMLFDRLHSGHAIRQMGTR